MKIKTFLPCLVVVLGLTAAVIPSFAGTVRTKDTPQKGGGFYGDSYHLKGKGNKEGFVNKEHHWKNPFSGFTKKKKSGKGVGPRGMPHSP